MSEQVQEVKVFRFDGTEYVQAVSQEEAEKYYLEDCDPFGFITVEEFPKNKWKEMKLRNTEFDDLPEFISMEDIVSGVDPCLIASKNFD
jgi:hypothetical protein